MRTSVLERKKDAADMEFSRQALFVARYSRVAMLLRNRGNGMEPRSSDVGAGYGSRTRLASLGSWSNTDIPTLQAFTV